MFSLVRKAARALRRPVRSEGTVAGRAWELRVGPSGRGYIEGQELLGRCEMGLPAEVSVVVMRRTLKESLERSTYERYIDADQTLAGGLPEEVRWLSTFQELRWPQLPREFWREWSVLADEQAHAVAWLDGSLAALLMDWPELAPGVPVVLTVLRGRVYLRLQHQPRLEARQRHAANVLERACLAAARTWNTPRPGPA
ncbi:hypothetical protein [Ramlibacter rhizophilus]|uniref:Uncharacterized protein n=1 Tax=Ramlibacter rhizophilus TaxID=1781167 RepID=A0A4Z0C2Q7_9BURK|nr:hypothetical protein [Ramlibacter rhizophilus]TFZ04750.1 hypothetical protein EZ242_03095 [Ramlibacter rhizophilus]